MGKNKTKNRTPHLRLMEPLEVSMQTGEAAREVRSLVLRGRVTRPPWAVFRARGHLADRSAEPTEAGSGSLPVSLPCPGSFMC